MRAETRDRFCLGVVDVEDRQQTGEREEIVVLPVGVHQLEAGARARDRRQTGRELAEPAAVHVRDLTKVDQEIQSPLEDKAIDLVFQQFRSNSRLESPPDPAR